MQLDLDRRFSLKMTTQKGLSRNIRERPFSSFDYSSSRSVMLAELISIVEVLCKSDVVDDCIAPNAPRRISPELRAYSTTSAVPISILEYLIFSLSLPALSC